MRKQNFPDNAYREIPQEYFSPCAKAGKVEAVNYTAHNHAGNGEEFEKTAKKSIKRFMYQEAKG